MACCYPSSIADTPRSPLVYGIFDCPRGEKKNLGKKPRKIVKSPAAFVLFGTYLCFEQKYNSYWTQVFTLLVLKILLLGIILISSFFLG